MKAKEIQELVKIVEKSTVDEIEITKWWGHKVRIRKNAAAFTPQTVEYIVPQTPAASAAPAPEATPILQSPPPADAAEEAKQAEPANNFIEVKAPMVGTFYRSSSPDAEPFAKEGDVVSPGKVLCIIEAMKLMNEIEVDVSGRIVKVLVDNAQPIEYNQSLFLIDPS